MSSEEPTKSDVVKTPETDEKKDSSDIPDVEELRFPPEEEEVRLFASLSLPSLNPHHSIFNSESDA